MVGIFGDDVVDVVDVVESADIDGSRSYQHHLCRMPCSRRVRVRKEFWGGNLRSLMDLSGRCTAAPLPAFLGDIVALRAE
jgi:hypothetical protein